MTAPTDVTYTYGTTVISSDHMNGINDWIWPAYNAGTFVFNGVTVTLSGTNGTAITFPATNGTLALSGANSDITSLSALTEPTSFRNKLINGAFDVWQRGTSFTSATTPANSDDTYLADRWYVLSDGNDVVDVTRAAGPTGSRYSLAMDVETANKKFGIAQIVETSNSTSICGSTCSLSFQAKISGTSLTTIKAGVVAWSGTEDSVTSDIISAWGADGVTPTLIANATFENTPADLNVTTSWATYTIENISVDTASAANLVVFIWADNTTTTIGDFLYVSDVQLEPGAVSTPVERRSIGTELALCQRYYEKSYSYDVNPGSVSELGAATIINSSSANATVGSVTFAVTKREIPSMVGYSPVTGTVGKIRNESTGTDENITFQSVGNHGFVRVYGTTTTSAIPFRYHWTADAEL